jgi:hypothetical protein
MAHPREALPLMPCIVAHGIGDALKAMWIAEGSVELRVKGGGSGVLGAGLWGAIKAYRLLREGLEELTGALAPLLGGEWEAPPDGVSPSKNANVGLTLWRRGEGLKLLIYKAPAAD